MHSRGIYVIMSSFVIGVSVQHSLDTMNRLLREPKMILHMRVGSRQCYSLSIVDFLPDYIPALVFRIKHTT